MLVIPPKTKNYPFVRSPHTGLEYMPIDDIDDMDLRNFINDHYRHCIQGINARPLLPFYTYIEVLVYYGGVHIPIELIDLLDKVLIVFFGDRAVQKMWRYTLLYRLGFYQSHIASAFDIPEKEVNVELMNFARESKPKVLTKVQTKSGRTYRHYERDIERKMTLIINHLKTVYGLQVPIICSDHTKTIAA